jgi:hypothetical protein
MIRIPNDMIACEPFVNVGIEKQGNTFVTAKQKNSLFATKVVYQNIREFSNGNFQGYPYRAGDTVYVRGDAMTLPWTKEVLDLGGRKVILVPCAYIQAVDKPMTASRPGLHADIEPNWTS